MSYDLNFWRYKSGIQMDHQKVYEQLSDGQTVEGLETLPIESIRQKFATKFAVGWDQPDQNSWEGDKGAFQIFTTDQFFRVDCYGLNSDTMNQIIDVLVEFECPLFDPQVGQRYDGA